MRLCRIDNCRAILQLPAEIDSPSTDAAYVSFVERSLQFTPSVWEFGNEPALFTNFSRPWSDWNTPGGTNATPETYAAIVPSILSAIRSVDPTTPVDPLAGVGTGAHSDGAWVEAVMAAAGARAQDVSLHSYIETGPAGNNSTFYEPLYGSSYSLPRLLPEITANISLGCPSCRTTSVIISEDGASTGDVNAPYESGFPMAMWDATQSIQAANSALSSIDFFAFQSGNPGSFELISGPLAPAYFLFKDVTPYLGSTVLNVTLNDSDGGRVQLGGWWGAGNVYSLLIVNLDTSNSAALTIAGSGFPTHGNIEWSVWNGSSVEPLGGATDWLNSTTVPPNTMELVSVYPAGPVSLPAAPTGVFAASSGPTSVRLSFSQPRGPVVNDSLTYGTPTASAPFCDPTGTIRYGRFNRRRSPLRAFPGHGLLLRRPGMDRGRARAHLGVHQRHDRRSRPVERNGERVRFPHPISGGCGNRWDRHGGILCGSSTIEGAVKEYRVLREIEPTQPVSAGETSRERLEKRINALALDRWVVHSFTVSHAPVGAGLGYRPVNVVYVVPLERDVTGHPQE